MASPISLSFVKEAVAVPTPAGAPSFLASTLSAGGNIQYQPATGLTKRGSVSLGPTASPVSFNPIPPGFAVSSAIRALVSTLAARQGGTLPAMLHPSGAVAVPAMPLAHVSLVDPTRYDVRVANDDGAVDADYPPVDFESNLVSVGASTFVLTDAATDAPLLRFRIRLEAPECAGAPAPLLLYVDWHAGAHSSGGRVAPFPVLLQPAPVVGGDAGEQLPGSPSRPAAIAASFHGGTFYSGMPTASHAPGDRTPASTGSASRQSRSGRHSSSSVASSAYGGESGSGMAGGGMDEF